MTNTDKILEEFDEMFGRAGSSGSFKGIRDDGIKAFLSTSIHQALAEERERVVAVLNEPMNFDSKTSDPVRDRIIKIINHERGRIRTTLSLDKPLTDKLTKK